MSGTAAIIQFIGIGSGYCAVTVDEPASKPLPQEVVILRIAEVTDIMEKQLLQNAANPWNYDVLETPIGRDNMVQSVAILLRNSKLAEIPNAGKALNALQEVSRIATASSGPLTKEEYLAMARQYEATREELRLVFGALPKERQDEAKAIARSLRAADEERMRR